jgi:hypothetical protein
LKSFRHFTEIVTQPSTSNAEPERKRKLAGTALLPTVGTNAATNIYKKITRSRNLLRRFSGAIANPVPFADLQVAILWMGASHFNFSLEFEPLSVRFERANQVAWAGAGKQTTLPLRNVNKPSTSPLVKFAE